MHGTHCLPPAAPPPAACLRWGWALQVFFIFSTIVARLTHNVHNYKVRWAGGRRAGSPP